MHYYEDLNIGDRFVTPRRTITQADIVNFLNLARITEPIFTDKEYWEKETLFKKLVAPGPLTFIISVGLFVGLKLFDKTVLAFLGLDQLRFSTPVACDDTIYVEAKVIEKRETRHPDRGIVTFNIETKNQKDQSVASWVHLLMLRRKQAG